MKIGLKRVFGVLALEKTELFGKYSTYEDALKNCRGYDNEKIIDAVVASTKTVLQREAKYERDSALFYETHFEPNFVDTVYEAYENWKRKHSPFTILDWGGALGSIYIQHKPLLNKILEDYRWVVVEQEKYVEHGNILYKNDKYISFISYADFYLTDKLAAYDPQYVILRGSLQYIADWKGALSTVCQLKPEMIVVDRLITCSKGKWCVQKVPRNLYDADYPVHLFTREEVEKSLSDEYELVSIRNSNVDKDKRMGMRVVSYKCLVFKKQGVSQ